MLQAWPLGTLASVIVGAVLVALVPVFIATARRHHQRAAISALVLVPLVPAVVGVVLLIVGNIGGLWLAYIGAYVLPMPWFVALVWSFTAVRHVVVGPAAPAVSAPTRSPVLLAPMDRDERRRRRRGRGY